MMKWFQKLGKSLILPVACLLVCGILMGIGYILAPGAMDGEAGGGAVNTIGLFLFKAGTAIVYKYPWLFAIGIAVGMADDEDGTAALAGLVSMFMITTLLSSGTVAALTGAEADPAFAKIANIFTGIIAGFIGAYSYNKFKSTKLPNALAFFSGKRSVAIVAGVSSIIVAAILFFVWPFVFGGLSGISVIFL